MNVNKALSFILTTAASFWACPSFAQVSIFNNLGTPITSTASLLEGAAEPFQTDTQSYFFNFVQLNLQYNPGGGDPVRIYLFSDGQYAPGSEIQQLTGTSLINASGLYTFSGNAILSPSTRYWIIAEGGASWYASGGPFSYGGEVLNGYNTWQSVAANFQMNIEATVVPEPTCALLLGLALAFSSARWAAHRTQKT